MSVKFSQLKSCRGKVGEDKMETRKRAVPPALVAKDSACVGCPASPSPTSPKSLPSWSGIRSFTATWSPVFGRKSSRAPKPLPSAAPNAGPLTLNRSASFMPDDISSNRHSLATISDFLGRGSGDRGYTIPSFRGFANSGSDSVKNELLDSVQTAIVQLFQKKRLATELHILQESVRRLTKTDSAPPVYEYFKEKLLRKGMVILRESMKNQTGTSLLDKLGQQWNHFYTVILPLLQAILYPLPQMDVPIRETCLVEFRDTVVLKINLLESLEFPDVEISPLIEQMLLVLQSVQDSDPPNKNYLRLEKLVARVVVPYLGYRGLYEGRSEPEIASLFAPAGKDTDPVQEQGKVDEPGVSKPSSLSLPRQAIFTKPIHHRQNSAISINLKLAPVAENDFIRRHSIALEQVS